MRADDQGWRVGGKRVGGGQRRTEDGREPENQRKKGWRMGTEGGRGIRGAEEDRGSEGGRLGENEMKGQKEER